MATETITIATGEVVEIADMIDNPAKYGFTWGYGSLEHGGVQVTTGHGAPFRQPSPELLTAFITTFGADRVTKWLNGGSKVHDQKLRLVLATDRALRLNDREMKARVIRAAFGIVTKSAQTTVYVEKKVAVYLSEDGNFESEDKAAVVQYNTMAREADAKIEKAAKTTK